MTKEVLIDSDKYKVIIAASIENEESRLVEYVEKSNFIYAKEFFLRFNELKEFAFFFVVKNFAKLETAFSIIGAWNKNNWALIDIFPSSKIIIVEDGL